MQQFVYTNEGKVLLREASREDIPKIYRMYEDYDPREWWSSEELTRFRYQLVEEARGKVFVAVLNGEAIGHAEIVLPKDKEEAVYLARLEIHDDYRRRKFGIEMVRYSAIIMKDLGYKRYATWPEVSKSKGLYKKVGLKEQERWPQLRVNIIGSRELEAKLKEELTIEDQPNELAVAVGCPWGREFNWQKSFKAGREGKLNYQGPYAQKVEIKDTTGVVLVDGESMTIYLPKEKKEDSQTIEDFLAYGSKLAWENNIFKLRFNIPPKIWEQLNLEDIWEIEKEEERLNMKMEF